MPYIAKFILRACFRGLHEYTHGSSYKVLLSALLFDVGLQSEFELITFDTDQCRQVTMRPRGGPGSVLFGGRPSRLPERAL
jgi:hypothetical protein